MNANEARIVDRGFRRYDGARNGTGAAVKSLWVNSLQRSLGLRRSAKFKIVPILTLAIAYLPAIVYVGIASIAGPASSVLIPPYHQYLNVIGLVVLLFCAIVGPEALCPDRRSGVLSLYLSSPLTRSRYLAAKALSVVTVLGGVTIGPLLLLLAGQLLQGNGPDGIGNVLILLGRILASGLLVAVYFTALTLAFSSMTDRRGYATGSFFGVVILTGIASGILVVNLKAPSFLLLINLQSVPLQLATTIFGQPFERPRGPSGLVGDPVSPEAIVAATLMWLAVAVGLVVARYRRLQVTR